VYSSTLIRFCSLGAILAGTLRAITSFVPETAPNVFLLYLMIDVCLLFAVFGLQRFTANRAQLLSALGTSLMLVAVVVLIGRDLMVAPVTIYAVAAATFSIGLDLFAIHIVRTRQLPLWIPVMWLISTILGPLGFFAPRLHLLFAIAGIIFGCAFAGAGVVMWHQTSKAR